MFKILAYLFAIERQAKAIHYSTRSNEFYGDHLLCDRIYDGISDLEDEIFENYYLGREQEAPSQKDIFKSATDLIPQNADDLWGAFKDLDNLVIGCIAEIESIIGNDKELTAGDNDLLGRICSDLQKKHGFIVRRLK